MATGKSKAAISSYSIGQPMRIQARPGSPAEKKYYVQSALPQAWAMPKAIAPGINPAIVEDLIYHGGKVVPQMEFQNVYLGGTESWQASDMASIDAAIKLAMRDKRLNNVMAQYFPGATMTCDVRDSFVMAGSKPSSMGEPAVQAMAISLFDGGFIKKSSLDSCIFNLILPSGTILKAGTLTSPDGLGGYHGSVHFTRAGKAVTIYYSANVYSEVRADGSQNGIVAFDKPWKNVVGTLYHELNEFRTDPDVNDAIAHNDGDFLGWNSRSGREVGDQPIFAARNNLSLVFQEVKATSSKKLLPIQFMYSNAVHGAEGPISKAHV